MDSKSKLADQLHKLIIRNIKKTLTYIFIYKKHLQLYAYMQLIRKFNKGIRFSLCVIDAYKKYIYVLSWKDTKYKVVTKAFEKLCRRITL